MIEMFTKHDYVLIACFVGSIVAAMIGLIVGLLLDSVLLALFAKALIPLLFCREAGLRHRGMLLRIVLYAAIGWWLTLNVQPSISEARRWRLKRIADAPFVGRDWYLVCSLVSGSMALVGTAFARSELKSEPKEESTDGALR